MEITCICPSGLSYTKDHILVMKEFKTIVMNYLRIQRLYENQQHELNLKPIKQK